MKGKKSDITECEQKQLRASKFLDLAENIRALLNFRVRKPLINKGFLGVYQNISFSAIYT